MGRKSRDLVPDASIRNGTATATLRSDEQGPRPRRVRRLGPVTIVPSAQLTATASGWTFHPSTSVKEMLSQ